MQIQVFEVGDSPRKKYERREKAIMPKEKPISLPGQTNPSKCK